ncbi:MAG: hypothetical protein HY063_10765 [Bacteroidetes bacterium]|nr:hypothetical protein [Bacteroidota bacterium]
MIITTQNNNTIEIENSLTGKETIKHNGKEVSSKRTMMGGIHIFKVNEDNEEVQYEVDIKSRWHGFGHYVTIRRKGELIFSNK